MLKKIILSLSFLALSTPLWAVDQDDIYTFFYGGTRFDRKLQAGAGVGYAPFNSLGFGVLLDQTSFSSQGMLEARWFIEPVEVAASFGLYKNYDAGMDKSSRFAFMIEADYLFAITPSIAAKVIARPQFVLRGTSSFLAALGFRFVF